MSAGLSTRRRGCRQHGAPRDRTWHCMTVGGMSCPTAQPSGAFPGAGWVRCGPDAPATTTPVVVVSGPDRGQTDEKCRCAADGVSGGIATGRRGCATHGFPSDTTRHCYVVGGTACTAPGVRGSGAFPSAAWKECRTSAE